MARLLIMEGNTFAHQARSSELGMRTASTVYAEAIAAHFAGVHLDVVNAAERGQGLPGGAALVDYDGLIVGGSGLHAYDAGFAVANQIDMVRAFAHTGRPILGSCWGLQIAVMAAGGEVGLSPEGREVGFARNIALTQAGCAHAFLAGRAAAYDAICIHYDEVTRLPAGATLLCANAHSTVQGAIVPLGKSEIWAVQYHPEFDLHHIAQAMRLYEKAMLADGFFKNTAGLHAYTARLDALHQKPEDKALAWQLGAGAMITENCARRTEIINWVKMCLGR